MPSSIFRGCGGTLAEADKTDGLACGPSVNLDVSPGDDRPFGTSLPPADPVEPPRTYCFRAFFASV